MNQEVTNKEDLSKPTEFSRDDNNEISKQNNQNAVDIKEANYNIVAKRFLGKF